MKKELLTSSFDIISKQEFVDKISRAEGDKFTLSLIRLNRVLFNRLNIKEYSSVRLKFLYDTSFKEVNEKYSDMFSEMGFKIKLRQKADFGENTVDLRLSVDSPAFNNLQEHSKKFLIHGVLKYTPFAQLNAEQMKKFKSFLDEQKVPYRTSKTNEGLILLLFSKVPP